MEIHSYTPNALNQYEAINPGSAVNPVYDLDGNLRNDAGINALTYGLKYEWDAENRLTTVRKADDTLIATYTYDYMGRRIRKTTTADAYPYQGASDTAYLYDGWNVVAEYSISGGSTVAIIQAYTWGLDLSGSMQGAGGVGGLLAIHRGPGIDIDDNRTWSDTFYPTYDGNGNVSEYLDKNGDEAAHFEYDPFGRLAASTGSPEDFTYRFSTKPQDFETGLYYYGYRYYDPVTGRWPSRDPIGEMGGVNLYGFVGNDPIKWIDRFGLEAYVLIYAQADSRGDGIFKQWADSIATKIKNGSVTDFDTSFRCFDSNIDTIEYLEVSSRKDLDRLKTIKNVRYVGSFGDGREETFWYLNKERTSTAISQDGAEMKDKKSNVINVNDFANMINWAGCDDCRRCDAGLAFELYHCNTNTEPEKGSGLDPIRDKLDKAFNSLPSSDGFVRIPNPLRDVFVGGFSSGVSNGYPGSRGWPRPQEESKSRVINPNCRPR